MARHDKNDLLARLAGKKPVSAEYTIVLDPEPMQAVAEARQALERAKVLHDPGSGAITEAEDDLAAAEAAAEGAFETLVLHGLPRDVYEALQLLHPPTDEQKAQEQTYNVDTLMPALIAACIVEDGDVVTPVSVGDLKLLSDGGTLPGRLFTTAEVAALIAPWNHAEVVTLWNRAVDCCTKARNPTLPFGSRPTRG